MIDILATKEHCLGPLLTFCDELVECARRQHRKLSICFASRASAGLQSALKNLPSLVMEDNNSTDISEYARFTLASMYERSTPELVREFDAFLAQEARGVFLWVSCALKRFLHQWQISSDVQQASTELSALPEALRLMYSHMLVEIPKERFKEGHHMLECVAGSARPLTLAEFRYALAFSSTDPPTTLMEANFTHRIIQEDDEFERCIQLCCGGLVEILHPSKTIRFIHETVQAFLDSGISQHKAHKDLSPSQDCSSVSWIHDSAIVPWCCHTRLLDSCIRFLCTPELKEILITFGGQAAYWKTQESIPISQLKPLAFLPYAVSSWIYHHMKAEFPSATNRTIEPFLDLDSGERSERFRIWFRLYCHIFRPSCNSSLPTFRSFSAYHGLEIHKGPQPRKKKTILPVEMHNAIVGNNLPLLSWFLEDNDCHLDGQGDLRFRSPLSLAISLQRKEIIEHLLKVLRLKYKLLEASERIPGEETIEDDFWKPKFKIRDVTDMVPGAPLLDKETPDPSYIYSFPERECSRVEPTEEELERLDSLAAEEWDIKEAWALKLGVEYVPRFTVEVRGTMNMNELGGLGISVSDDDDEIERDSTFGIPEPTMDDTTSRKSQETIREEVSEVDEEEGEWLTRGWRRSWDLREERYAAFDNDPDNDFS